VAQAWRVWDGPWEGGMVQSGILPPDRLGEACGGGTCWSSSHSTRTYPLATGLSVGSSNEKVPRALSDISLKAASAAA